MDVDCAIGRVRDLAKLCVYSAIFPDWEGVVLESFTGAELLHARGNGLGEFAL
jgi:hypothetical protein